MAAFQKLPSGKWRALVRKSGVSKTRSFQRKSDAMAWAVQIESNLSGAGAINVPTSMKLGDAIEAYGENVEVSRTVEANLKRMRLAMGGVPLAKFSAVHLQEYVDARMATGITGATIAGDLSALSSVLKWLRHSRQLDVDPSIASNVRAALSTARIDTRSAERDRVPTDEELDAICAYLRQNKRQKLPVADVTEFAAVSGLRLSEICRIKIEDVRWNEGAILVRERKDPKRKARRNEVVPMPPAAMDAIRTATGQRTKGEVFPYDPRSVGTAFRRAVRKCGIEDLHFHDLRHRAITDLARIGMTAPQIQQLSGHRDLKHLNRYVNLKPADFHAAYEKASRND